MRKPGILFVWLFLFEAAAISAQTYHPVLVISLSDTINESSGIEVNSRNAIWTHNDSGDLPRIFKTDTLGNLLRILNLTNVTAIDMEDMTQDEEGNYYLGDFGNNLNNRKDLCIYKIPNPDSVPGNTVIPQLINFNFPDQLLFPPAPADMNFDCEAMFHFRDSIYLFSKNRGISTFSRMYRLPDQPGTYTAQLVDSFNTVQWITSADISPSGKSMVLLSNEMLWLFTSYPGTDFFGGTGLKLSIDSSQKEAIVFISDTEVYLTDERFLGTGGNLYEMNLTQWIDGIPDFPDNPFILNIYPNPATDKVMIGIDIIRPSAVRVELFNSFGQMMLEESSNLIPGKNEICLSVSRKLKGFYFIRINMNEILTVTRMLIID